MQRFTAVEIPVVFRPRRRASYSPSRPLDQHDGPRRFWSGDVPTFPGPWTWLEGNCWWDAECWWRFGCRRGIFYEGVKNLSRSLIEITPRKTIRWNAARNIEPWGPAWSRHPPHENCDSNCNSNCKKLRKNVTQTQRDKYARQFPAFFLRWRSGIDMRINCMWVKTEIL